MSFKRQLDFAAKSAKAKKMSRAELEYGIQDCLECVMQDSPDADYYSDEASVYMMEISKRASRRHPELVTV